MAGSELDVTALERERDHPLDPLVSEALDLATVILGHAAILATTVPAGDERREDVEAITAAGRRLAGVIAQLLLPAGQGGDLSQASGHPAATADATLKIGIPNRPNASNMPGKPGAAFGPHLGSRLE